MIQLTEIDGQLMKVKEVKIDEFNVKRSIVPLSEKELAQMKRNLTEHYNVNKTLMDKYEEGLEGKRQTPVTELEGEAQLNAINDQLLEAKNRFSKKDKPVRQKKSFSVASESSEEGEEQDALLED